MITIVLSPEAADSEEASAEIVVQRFSEDGGVEEELKLEGDLLEAQSLAVQLSSEGSCVQIEADPAAGEGTPSPASGSGPVKYPGAEPDAP